MKKVKVMLMSVVLLAVVGGALAFKAKYDQTFCVTNPDAQGNCPNVAAVGACPLRQLAVTTTNAGGVLLCTTPKPAGITCGAANVSCPINRVINNDGE